MREIKFAISSIAWLITFCLAAQLLRFSIANGSGATYSELPRSESVTATPYTVGITNDVLLVDSATDVTLNLPTCGPGPFSDKVYVIKKIGVGNVIIDGDGTQTIDSALTKTIQDQYSAMNIICNASAGTWSIF